MHVEAVTVPQGENAGRLWFPHVLRGVAALGVVLVHLGQAYPTNPVGAGRFGQFPALDHPIEVPWSAWFRFETFVHVSVGEVSVLLFFLVSGFVIPFSLRRTSIPRFTVRRFFRIYPALWACLAVTLLVLVIQRWISGSPVPFTTAVIAKNALLIAPYTGDRWIDPVAWTLAIEELFYVCAAVLAWRGVLGEAKWLVGLAAVCAASAFFSFSDERSPAVFWLSYNAAFIPFIFVGTVIHEVWDRRWSRNKGIVTGTALLACFATALYAGPNNYQATDYLRSGLVGAAIFVTLAVYAPRIRYSGPLDLLASVSYPLYLLHFVNGMVLLRWLHAHGVSYFIGLPVAITGAIVGALLVHRFVELPMMRLGRRIGAAKRTTADVH